MQTITPFLWYNEDPQTVMNYYLSIFKDGKITSTIPGPGGSLMGGTFELLGQKFMLINGGPEHANFNESVSFFVSVETQEEIDYYWDKLTADGGTESRCGWLKDKYGLSWQIIPSALGKMLGDSDREKAGRAMQAMLGMNKINIQEMRDAFDGK